MKVLALDAALGPFSVALDLDGEVRAEQSAGNDALETGLGRIAGLLAGARLELRDLDRIAVGTGPGSFTGIRIALSYARALAYGAGLPIVGISSYDLLTPTDAPDPLLTVVSGRPGVVCARLRADGGETTACGPTATVIERLGRGRSARGPVSVVASRQDVIGALTEGGWDVIECDPPSANPALTLARLARARPPASSPHGIAPDYGEIPAVTVPKGGTKRNP